MRLLIQRVKMASVFVENKIVANIAKGAVLFLGIKKKDHEKDVHYLVDRILNLRFFSDELGKFQFNVQDAHAELLVISQFTLYASYEKGRRPSFEDAASKEEAQILYQQFLIQLKKKYTKVESGQFQANMIIDMCQDGPVSIMLDSNQKKIKN